nr:hypothetical protein Iba_chr14aCG13720 [Ipomoea batatas]
MLKFFQKQNSSSITHDKPIAVLSIAISADASNSNQTMKMQMKEMTLHYPKVMCLSFLVELVNVFCILHNSQLIVHISSINIFNLLHCCCLSAEAVLFLHLFFSVRADNNHSFRLDWLHSSSLLRRRLSRHLHLQKQFHPHSQHQYISAANQEIKVRDKFFRTSDLQQQSMMMGCCLSPEAVLFLHLFFSVKADYNHSFRLDWLHSSSLLRRRLSRHLHLQQQLHPHSQHQYFLQQIKRSRQGQVL